MHPYWIKKIEEQRKISVTTFWVSMALIILIPLLLVLEGDSYLIVAMLCFGGAALRLYWLGDPVAAQTTATATAPAGQATAAACEPFQNFQQSTGVMPAAPLAEQFIASSESQLAHANTHPEMIDSEGNLLQPQYLGFEAVAAAEEDLYSPENYFNSVDEMTLADPETHPHSRQQARRGPRKQLQHQI